MNVHFSETFLYISRNGIRAKSKRYITVPLMASLWTRLFGAERSGRPPASSTPSCVQAKRYNARRASDVFPRLVWVNILAHCDVTTVVFAAHACRTLHKIVTSYERCACAQPEHWRAAGNLWAPHFWREWRAHTPSRHAGHLGYHALYDHVVLVHFALRAGEDPRVAQHDALHTACSHGRERVVRRLLCDARVDPQNQYSRALLVASRYGHVGVVELLLRDGRCNPVAVFFAALTAAIIRYHDEVVRLLLRDRRVRNDPRLQSALGEYYHHGAYACFVRDCICPTLRETDPEGCFCRLCRCRRESVATT